MADSHFRRGAVCSLTMFVSCARLSVVLAVLISVACQTASGDRTSGAQPAFQSWGTLREALRDGETQTRVDAVEVARPGVFGVGAASGLQGEISIVDGVVVHSLVEPGGSVTTRGSDGESVEATFLFVADVPAWQSFEVAEDIDPSDAARFLAAEAAARGLDVGEPFVFRIEGELLNLRCHVMRGECPVRARMLGKEMATPPFETHEQRVEGEVVGFHALHAGGQLTHHGESMHAHVLFETASGRITAHAESFGFAEGARVFLRAPL